MKYLLLLVSLILAGCSHDSARDRFIQSLDHMTAEPTIPLPLQDQRDWLYLDTPHGRYANLGNGWIAGPDGLSFQY